MCVATETARRGLATARARLRHYKNRSAARRDDVLRANRDSLQSRLPPPQTMLAEFASRQAA